MNLSNLSTFGSPDRVLSVPHVETQATLACRLQASSYSSIASSLNGECTSPVLTWAWEKISGLFRLICCCGLKMEEAAHEIPLSYFYDFDGDEMRCRLLLEGEGTENEVRLSPSSASVKDIRFSSSTAGENVAIMLKKVMREKNIHELTTTEFSQAKYLCAHGFHVSGALLFDLQSQDFLDIYMTTKLKSLFAEKRPSSAQGKLLLNKIEEQIVSGIVGIAFLIEDDAQRQTSIEINLQSLESFIPGFDGQSALVRAQRGTILTEEQKALLAAIRGQYVEQEHSLLGSWNILSITRSAPLPPQIDLNVSLPYDMLFELFEELGEIFPRGLASPQPMRFTL